MEIRRFGVGNRRPHGPAGTTGLAGQVIHADARGSISELAFSRRASFEPHTSPNSAWLVVIEGGGWVRVGDERARVAAGEAVLWPAHEVRAAWTDLSEMRAFVVELAGSDDALVRGILDGRPLALEPGRPRATGGPGGGPAAPADGELRREPGASRSADAEGEPQ